MSLFKQSAILTTFLALGACSTPPDLPDDQVSQQLVDQDTAPGIGNAVGDRVAEVTVSGVNADGIASYEIGAGDSTAEMEGNSSEQVNFPEVIEFEPVIYFGYDQAELSPKALQKIEYFSGIANANPNLSIILEGHTDDRGTPEYNLALGEKRAKSVQDAMLTFGVNPDKITANSYGEEYPVAFDKNEEAWQLNRRVEITIR